MEQAKVIETPDDELLRLDSQLCFALYASSRAIIRTYRERLEPIGITYPQYLVLITLWEQNGQTISEIGERLMLDSGTLTPLLKRLEVMGHVRRQRSSADERQVLIHLTESGRQLREKAAGARRHVVCRLDMAESEIADLRANLMDVVARLERTGTGAAGAGPGRAPADRSDD
ncbi:MAG: MarR family transcriptional regulator [Hyphomicrobiaceae bacterium]|nr:MarR family transcriptional regulator [Hyphomicrobiaceae bacterium]